MLFFKKSGKKDNMWLIVGLGNPGRKYQNTRHNIGFDAIEELAKNLGVRINRSKFSSLTAEGDINGIPVLLMMPQTLMNLSGRAVGEAAAFYKVPAERVIVLCDDINLAAGAMRIRDKGSAGGHNGLKDIIARLGSDGFYRVRIGAGRMKGADGGSMPDFVLGVPSAADRKAISDRYPDAAEACCLIVEGKLGEAQTKFNH